MAVEETEFTQVFRGYDKDEVDKSLNALRRDIITANTKIAEQGKEHKRLLARIEELTAELEEVGSPT
ncbi:MAG TPA: DivIVA domain-containing protein, partial [Actinomycetota bacterium]|nr:DivIVA domain-containing protein [Actinomycetota bacterium]